MTSFLTQSQVDQIREAFYRLNKTFAFTVTIRKTTHTNQAFKVRPAIDEFSFDAIREFVSLNKSDQFRNDLGTTSAHEMRLYIHWRDFEVAGLIDSHHKILLSHNDTVIIENQEYEILSYGGVAQMDKKPAFVFLFVKRKWAKANQD